MNVPRSRLVGPPDHRRPRTLDDALRGAAAGLGADQRIFTFDDGTVLTVGDLDARSTTLARALVAAGGRPGDRLAVLADGNPCWPVAIFAAARAGMLVVGLNTKQRRRELEWVLASAGPRFVIVGASGRDGHALDLLGVPRTAVPPAVAPRMVVPATGRVEPLATFVTSSEGASTSLPPVSPDAEALIQFTSGSTALPKGAVLSQDAMVRLATNLAEATGIDASDTVFSPMPFYHVGGAINTAVAAVVTGATMVVPGTYDPGWALAALAESRCTAHLGHEAVFAMELDHPEFGAHDLSRLRKGWAVGSSSLLRRIHGELGMTDLVQGYGMSEGGTATCGRPDDPPERRFVTVGRPLPGTEVELRDDTGDVVPWGSVGEILFRSPAVMTRYWDDPAATAATLDDAGWLHTGDLGRIDEDGHLVLVGRQKDMVKSGGENVSALEVESYLTAHQAIQHAAVFALADDTYGEIVAAAVSPVPGSVLTTEDVVAHAVTGLATFKVPRRVWIVEAMPITATGKVHKALVIDQLVSTTGRSRPDATP